MENRQELEWGHLVETLRVLRGWGQEELAVAAGLDPMTIAKQEQGVSRPSPEGRKKIEEALGVEGWSREVEIYLAELREKLADPGRREAAKGFEQAGAESSRLMQAAIWMGLAELRGAEDGEPGLPWGILIATLRTLLGWG
jgi:transcriptional regulator with XRE-family HTH domain